MKNPYDVLGVSRNAPMADCQKAFRKLSMKYHPDNGGDEAKFMEINEAFTAIKNGVSVVQENVEIKRSELRHVSLFVFA